MRLRLLVPVLLLLAQCRDRHSASVPAGPDASVVVDAVASSPLAAGDTGQVDAATSAPHAAIPFELPRPPWGGTAENVAETRPFYLDQFFFDCADLTAVSRWRHTGKTRWSVTAYRCAHEIPSRVIPLWESDGFFVYGHRRDVVIEVYGHKDGGPSPATWRSYLDKALAGIPPTSPKHLAPPPTARVDKKKAKAFIALLREKIADALIGNCVRERDVGDEQSTLGREMDRMIPSDQGGFETVLTNVMFCRICDLKKRCRAAFESLEGADVWVERYAK